MLAGQPLLPGQNALEVALKHVKEEPPPLANLRPDLPATLCALIHRMMSKDPAARPQSGREVLRELSQPVGQATAENPFAGLTIVPSSSARLTADAGGATPPSLPTPA